MTKKYANGYWPKIDYWLTKLSQYRVEQNPIMINLAITRLQYYMGKEQAKSNTIAGVEFTQSLNQVAQL
jgi:hypothetical protein